MLYFSWFLIIKIDIIVAIEMRSLNLYIWMCVCLCVPWSVTLMFCSLQCQCLCLYVAIGQHNKHTIQFQRQALSNKHTMIVFCNIQKVKLSFYFFINLTSFYFVSYKMFLWFWESLNNFTEPCDNSNFVWHI